MEGCPLSVYVRINVGMYECMYVCMYVHVYMCVLCVLSVYVSFQKGEGGIREGTRIRVRANLAVAPAL